MKILSFQTQTLYLNGGAARLLRRIYQGKEKQILSISVSFDKHQNKGLIEEILIPLVPIQKAWMKWKLRPFFKWFREDFLFFYHKNRVVKMIEKNSSDIDVIHIINHGKFSVTPIKYNNLSTKKIWVSFHDHFSLSSSFNDTSYLWNKADRRLVISEELGDEYQRIFGEKEYEIVTDGVSLNELSTPKKISGTNLTVYFGGLLHIGYYPLFETLAHALDELSKQGKIIKLVLRGTQKIVFLENRQFSVHYRNDFVSDAKIKKELDTADLLYLPIKFNDPNFYLYSLSTKMVGYLGASGQILFHGPKDSAASKILKKHNAASICNSLDSNELIKAINKILAGGKTISTNAKKLALRQFSLETNQKKFWEEVG